jgi:membrane-bound lytic murein transglycosylase B
VTVGLALLVGIQQADQPQISFPDFLVGLRTEALTRGISQATVDTALTGIEPVTVVVARDRAQPEMVQSLDAYVSQRLTPSRVEKGRALAAANRDLLARIEQTYGLNAPLMVSIWGLESNYGSFTGSYPTIAALATLAYDGRRPLFRTELFEALKIVDLGRATAGELKGSWAGAMGQPQFMPSSYLTHAVDFDGDGHADIWTSLPDVFASMANYLKNSGWESGGRWGREVKVSKAAMTRIDRAVGMRAGGCRATREMTVAQPLSAWKKYGVTLADGRPLPAADLTASLVRGDKRNFLVYSNYQALLAYNCSHSYAISIGLLADRIGASQKPEPGHSSKAKGKK